MNTPEPSNIVDKFAISVKRDGEVGGHLMNGKSGRLAKTIFYFLRTVKKNTCTVVVTGKTVNRGDGESMQVSVPCTLHFKEQQNFINILSKV